MSLCLALFLYLALVSIHIFQTVMGPSEVVQATKEIPQLYLTENCPIVNFPEPVCWVVDDDTLLDIIANQPDKELFVMFYAPTDWCANSRELFPVWTRLAAFYPNLPFYSVDAYNQDKYNLRFSIFGYPTVLTIKNSTIIGRFSGDYTLANLLLYTHEHSGQLPSILDSGRMQVLINKTAKAAPIQKDHDFLGYLSLAYVIFFIIFHKKLMGT